MLWLCNERILLHQHKVTVANVVIMDIYMVFPVAGESISSLKLPKVAMYRQGIMLHYSQ